MDPGEGLFSLWKGLLAKAAFWFYSSDDRYKFSGRIQFEIRHLNFLYSYILPGVWAIREEISLSYVTLISITWNTQIWRVSSLFLVSSWATSHFSTNALWRKNVIMKLRIYLYTDMRDGKVDKICFLWTPIWCVYK